MSGRRPKPTALKLVEGTDRVDRARENEPVPPEGAIEKPAFLKKRASELWDQYAPITTAMGTLTVADAHLLAEWCQLTVKMESGRTKAAERAQRRMLGAELGIGAAARAKIGTKGKKSDDPTNEFFQAS